MKRTSFLFAVVAVFCCSVGASAAGGEEPPAPSAYFPLWQASEPNIADLVLIYCGGLDRPAWTPDQFAPYVSLRRGGTEEESWLFDGFLMMEYRDARGREYARGYKQKPARRVEWQWLLERFFEPGRTVSALDRACEETAKRIGPPLRPRQVVLTLPEPIWQQKDWGSLDGRALDFTRVEDRAAACEWYVQTALEKWRRAAPKHLRLAGFYWVAEHNRSGHGVQPLVSKIIHDRGKRFFWIPYWQARDAENWRPLGFDVAYQQPNHFQRPEVPDSRLDDACRFARRHGMGMEIELNRSIFETDGKFRNRLWTYLNAFERHGVHAGAALAYYEQQGQLLYLSSSEDPEVRQVYERLAVWVAERQRKADALSRERAEK